ncbi:hypothetical protein ACFL2Q_02415 [Thermodesulfobacteriota bacterium]
MKQAGKKWHPTDALAETVGKRFGLPKEHTAQLKDIGRNFGGEAQKKVTELFIEELKKRIQLSKGGSKRPTGIPEAGGPVQGPGPIVVEAFGKKWKFPDVNIGGSIEFDSSGAEKVMWPEIGTLK